MSSLLDLETMSSQLTVEFIDVQDKYSAKQDILCRFSLNNYKIHTGDRLAIFQTGWKTLRDYVLFEWVMGYNDTESCQSVTFHQLDLPSDDAETLFQFCYISFDNVVQGVSTPFQISSENKSHTNCTNWQKVLASREKEISRLKEDNAILKESLKSVIEQRKFQRTKNYDEEINDLKELTSKLRAALIIQQKEIDELRTEVHKNRHEINNLNVEKLIAGKKIEVFESKEAEKKKLYTDDFELKSIPPLPTLQFD